MKKSAKREKLGLLVGGGPAPGINSVIGAATIEAVNQGLEVVGILDGFKWLSRGDTSHTIPLTIHDVSETRFRGGSMLHTSRENPTKDPAKMQNVVKALGDLGLSYLVTIGGDDTAFSASKTAEFGKGAIRVAHVPKTIDNDLPLPNNAPTFGFQTARTIGEQLTSNLMRDARTTRRWYLVIAMGRTAGHLALGLGATSGAPLTIIPEELSPTETTLDLICDIVEGSILKSRVVGRDYGVAVIAEGVGDFVKEELAKHPLAVVEHDEHGHFRLAEVPLGLIFKRLLQERAVARGEKVTFVDVTIGYELRCADPIPFDIEYTQQLGWGAVRYLLQMGEETWSEEGAMMSVQSGEIVPIPFSDILNPETGKTTVRRVNVNSDTYRSARSFMIRLERSDFENAERAKALAEAAKMTLEEFRGKYGQVVGL